MGVTPFMEAAAEGHEIIVQTFLQHVNPPYLLYLVKNHGCSQYLKLAKIC